MSFIVSWSLSEFERVEKEHIEIARDKDGGPIEAANAEYISRNARALIAKSIRDGKQPFPFDVWAEYFSTLILIEHERSRENAKRNNKIR